MFVCTFLSLLSSFIIIKSNGKVYYNIFFLLLYVLVYYCCQIYECINIQDFFDNKAENINKPKIYKTISLLSTSVDDIKCGQMSMSGCHTIDGQ